jgi:hypothetical protein
LGNEPGGPPGGASTLLLDARPQPGQPPAAGLHVLIVGVSRYRHLPGGAGPPAAAAGLDGLGQLPTSARTAADLAAWLLGQAGAATLTLPLQTLRLLLSPSDAEPGLPAVPAAAYDEIRRAANDWRADARSHRDGIALWFCSGHGVGGTLDDSILLPEDFADPAAPGLLARVVSLADLGQGMRQPRNPLSTVATSQVYLWDACRNRPAAFQRVDWTTLPTIWADDSAGEKDDRRLAEVLATIADQLAFAGRPGERTLFGQALLECLEGAAAEVTVAQNVFRWPVDTVSIVRYLQERMDERNRELSTRQQFRTGSLLPIPLLSYGVAPRVEVQLSVRPPEHAPQARVGFDYQFDPPATRLIDPVVPHPFPLDLPMGLYKVGPPGGPPLRVELRPPRRAVEVEG